MRREGVPGSDTASFRLLGRCVRTVEALGRRQGLSTDRLADHRVSATDRGAAERLGKTG